MPKTIEDFFQTLDDRTHFSAYGGCVRYVLDRMFRDRGGVHGWYFVERVFEYYTGTGLAETATADKIITLLFHFGILEPVCYCPTTSQAAFFGLTRPPRFVIRELNNVSEFPKHGHETHFQFNVKPQVIEEVLATKEMVALAGSRGQYQKRTFDDLPIDTYFLFSNAGVVARKVDASVYEEVATGQRWDHACPDMFEVRELTQEETTVTRDDIASHFGVDRISVRKDGVYVDEVFGPRRRWRWVGYQNAILAEIILKRVKKSS